MKKNQFTHFLLFLSLLTISISANSVFAQERKPMTVEDLYAIGRVSDPQLSPDGKTVLYVVTYYSMEKNNSNSDIYSVSIKGGTPRQLTQSPKSDFNPRWSPDGNTIAFISSRENGTQVWLMDADGENQRKLTNISTGAGDVQWSPRGEYLLFVSEVYPDCADDDCNKRRDDAKENSKVKARVFEKLPIRVWDHWREGRYSHLFSIQKNGGVPADLTPGEYDVPPIDLTSKSDFDISPDGQEIAFVRNTEKSIMTGTNNDIWIAKIDGTDARCITKDNKATDNQPVYSPDGKYIAYRAMSRPGFEADTYFLMVYNRETKLYKNVTAGADRSVGDIFWSPDSKRIFFTAEEAGYESLFDVAFDGGDIRRIMKGTFEAVYQGDPRKVKMGMYRTNFSIGKDGQTFLFLGQRSNYPAEVVTAYFNGNAVSGFQQLTFVNDSLLKTLDTDIAESFTFKGDGGTPVQGWILKPPAFDPQKKYPMIFLVHGGPQGSWLDNFHYRWNYQMFASQGYVVVAINPRGSTGFGQKFVDEISGDWGGKPFNDLMKGLDYVIKQYPFIDANRMGAAGASYGGYMMDWFLGHTNRFKAIVTHSGVFNLESMYGSTEELWFPEWEFKGTPWTNPAMYAKFSPHKFAKNFKTPTLVTHGEQDFRVPVTQGMELFTTLQRMGVPSKFIYFPDETHFISKPQNARLWWNSVMEWFNKYLK